jgi:hypothetical protein
MNICPHILPSFILQRFPTNPEKKAKWIKNISREGWMPSSYSRICSDHFHERFIDRTGQIVKLKDDAVPTRFKKFPKHLKKVTGLVRTEHGLMLIFS